MLLDNLGGFRTQHRGLVEVKSRGLVDTYWLLGKEGGVSHREGFESNQQFGGAVEGLAPTEIEITKDPDTATMAVAATLNNIV